MSRLSVRLPHARLAAGLVIGFLLGATVTLALQGAAEKVPHFGRPGAGRTPPASVSGLPRTTPEPPATFLAWVPGGMPDGFEQRASHLSGIDRAVVVGSDNTWLTKSYSAQGTLVDDPPKPYMIPLESAELDPHAYAPFLPPADRSVTADLAAGRGILGETSAKLRGLGVGSVLEFGYGRPKPVRVRIAAVLPDELVGANELLVSREVGRRIGIDHDRYALLQPSGNPTDAQLTTKLRSVVPSGSPIQVRAPGETPYFRQGDAVLPPVRIKQIFGEFDARPNGGYLDIDPAWERQHIETAHVPVLGEVQCNSVLIPQLRAAMAAVKRRGLAGAVHEFDGCYSPRFILRNPEANISHHSWGMAFDINASANPYGATPQQNPRLVRTIEHYGFIWGGTFIVPDGNHFEYRSPPPGG
ncbi:MAG: M15 family metallopeptidase [Actinomycetota bacterium]